VERSRLTLKSGGFENLIAQTQSERERMKERQEQQARDLEEIAAQGDETRERMHRLDIEIAQIDTQTSDLMARLEERGESSASIDWQAVAILNSEETQKELARLRQSIASFGGVNLGALEDYEKLKERNDFLSLQMKDLEDASQSLKDVIAQMDEASSRQFQAAFLEVNARFSDLFTDLFNGGTAQLELSDPSNLLETGVEIVARPPGKKLQNLMLLSSGERALTATAFLMALLKVKPSPFVILDELDAPLDDANVERVAGKIKEFSESSQFIIITHNRKTMEYGSALYGVTMEEAGVSRLVSLNLEETSREKRASSSDFDLIAY
jgi:chromosome segregation protein